MAGEPHAIYMRFDDAFSPFARACLNSIARNYPDHPQLIVDYDGNDARMVGLLEALSAERLAPEPPPEYLKHLRRARTGSAIGTGSNCFEAGFPDTTRFCISMPTP